MTTTEILIVLATLAGPITAVQAQKWLERAGEARRRKMLVFYNLMATRATRLANEHVQSLNMIELEFRGSRSRDKKVIEAWRLYADHLNGGGELNEASAAAWVARRDEMFFDLLHAISRALGFQFDKVQLKRGVYYPIGHGQNEEAQRRIQAGLVEVLTGSQPLSMRVTEFPTSPEAIAAQAALTEKLAKAYTADGALRVEIKGGDAPASRERSKR